MLVEFNQSELDEIEEMVNDLCRDDKKQVVLQIAHKLGRDVLGLGIQNGLNLDETLCVAYVLSDSMDLAADKYNEILENQ